MSDPLVLASTSPYRKQLLLQLGVPFTALPPRLNEELAQKEYQGPKPGLASHLAREKALSLTPQCPGQWVLGSDQVLIFFGHVLHKPKTEAQVFERLMELQGQTHQLTTAFCLVSPEGQEYTGQVTATMEMHPLTEDEIKDYIHYDQSIGCAGGYKIESQGVRLFKSIDCEDFFSIVGLPLLSLGCLFRQLGIFGPKSSDSFPPTSR